MRLCKGHTAWLKVLGICHILRAVFMISTGKSLAWLSFSDYSLMFSSSLLEFSKETCAMTSQTYHPYPRHQQTVLLKQHPVLFHPVKTALNANDSENLIFLLSGSTQFPYNPLTIRMLSSTPPTQIACAPSAITQAAPHQQNRIWEREPAPLLSAQYETLSDSDD